MKIKNNITNAKLLEIIFDNIHWTSVRQRLFCESISEKFNTSGWVTPDQRRVLMKIANRVMGKRSRTKVLLGLK